ncbi:MAG TPA: heme o synthase [Candidatus Saccharimonadales bacterium]|jgi:protoheme IX farnesyltransferase|nr:heme o synthase [Candidatus Saccharimonadales bacterium]
MATEPILAALSVSAVQRRRIESSRALFDYWELTKPEINFLIAITVAAGFWLGSPAMPLHFPWMPLLHTLLGTIYVASGAATLNQLIEVQYDAQMRRTARRPLASGRIAPSPAFWFGSLLSVFGVVYLCISTNALASLLAALTLFSYLLLYTPLKRITPLCTLVGAIPGATPPLIGWAAARGHLDAAAWALFAIVFLWQFPHFMSIAWMYRDDYARAGYLVLPASDLRDRFVAWQCLLPALVLFIMGIVPALRGQSGIVYIAVIPVLGGFFLYYSARFALQRSIASARHLLLASVVYLPALFALLALDKK